MDNVRLVKTISDHLGKMQAVYGKLSNSLSKATVAPESLDQCLGATTVIRVVVQPISPTLMIPACIYVIDIVVYMHLT